MSIDDMLGRDPRLVRLAKACGISKYEAAGRLVLEVWPVCYDRATAVVPEHDIDTAAGIDGFAGHMVSVGLAAYARNGVRVSGVQERIDYLIGQRDRGKRGGLKSAESRTSVVKQTLKRDARAAQPINEASLKPPIAPSPASAPDTAIAPVQKIAPPSARQPSGSHQLVIAKWTELYTAKTGGPPTWPGDRSKNVKAVKSLLESHTEDEVVRRMQIHHDTPRGFPPQPWDMATFAARFDELAAAGVARDVRFGSVAPMPHDQYPEGAQKF